MSGRTEGAGVRAKRDARALADAFRHDGRLSKWERDDLVAVLEALASGSKPAGTGPDDEASEWFRKGWVAGNASTPVPRKRPRLTGHTPDCSMAYMYGYCTCGYAPGRKDPRPAPSSTPAPSEPAVTPDAWGVEITAYADDDRTLVRRLDDADTIRRIAERMAAEYRDGCHPKVVPLYRHAPASEPSEREADAEEAFCAGYDEALVRYGVVCDSDWKDGMFEDFAMWWRARLSTPTPEPEEAK